MAFSFRRTRETGNRRQARRPRSDHRSDLRTGQRTDHRSSDEDEDEDEDENGLEAEDSQVPNATRTAPSTTSRGGTTSG